MSDDAVIFDYLIKLGRLTDFQRSTIIKKIADMETTVTFIEKIPGSGAMGFIIKTNGVDTVFSFYGSVDGGDLDSMGAADLLTENNYILVVDNKEVECSILVQDGRVCFTVGQEENELNTWVNYNKCREAFEHFAAFVSKPKPVLTLHLDFLAAKVDDITLTIKAMMFGSPSEHVFVGPLCLTASEEATIFLDGLEDYQAMHFEDATETGHMFNRCSDSENLFWMHKHVKFTPNHEITGGFRLMMAWTPELKAALRQWFTNMKLI